MIATANACFERKWKYIAPLVSSALSEDVVEADVVVSPSRELM